MYLGSRLSSKAEVCKDWKERHWTQEMITDSIQDWRERDVGPHVISRQCLKPTPHPEQAHSLCGPRVLSAGKKALKSAAWLLFLTAVSKNIHLTTLPLSLFTQKRKKTLIYFLCTDTEPRAPCKLITTLLMHRNLHPPRLQNNVSPDKQAFINNNEKE